MHLKSSMAANDPIGTNWTDGENDLIVADHFGMLFRLYDFAREPKAFEIVPPVDEALHLHTANYRASFD